MNHSNASNSNLNNINNLNIATNINTKYKKLNRTNFKTISSHNSSNNTSKSNNSKENVKIIHNVLLEKRKKLSTNKKQKNEIKNCIPKIKTEIFSNSNIMINNSNLKNKKEFQPQQFQQRNSSFQHKKCSDLLDDCQNKNVNAVINKSLTKVNASNSKEKLNSLNMNNTYNANYKNIKYTYIIKVLLYYIESMYKKIKYFLHKIQIEKNNKIKELSLQNKFLMNENKNLKIKLIEVIYTVKLYTTGKYNLFNDKYSELTKQIIQENNFLRKLNKTSKNIDGNFYNLLQKQIQIEKLKKELTLQNQIKDLSSRSNIENSNNYQNNKIDSKNQNQSNENNPFYFNSSTGDTQGINNKVKHKRQRTHFNLGALDDENNSSSNNSNRESINNSNNKSYVSSKENISSSNTIIENDSNENKKNNNVLDNTLKEMISGNKALKKINGSSKKNLFEKNEANNNGEKIVSSNNIYTFIKTSKTIGNNPSSNIGKLVNNIPYNTKNEHLINNKESLENKSNNKNINENENNNNLSKKQQQSIYYRSAREKEKKKIEFTK